MLVTVLLFDHRYPAEGDTVGQAFVSLPEFGVWVFLQAILLCTLSITLIPLWVALFSLIGELLSFLALLQANLLILGIILSMTSITTAGFRAIFVALKVANNQNSPISYAIMIGLIFSIIAPDLFSDPYVAD